MGEQIERVPAEVFPPGEFIQEELDARGWTQEDLAKVIGCTLARVNEVIKGKRGLSEETAIALGQAFGTGPEYWMNLEASYRLSRIQRSNDAVARRARLYSVAPMRELLKRRWIEGSENIDILEQRVCKFYEIDAIQDTPKPYPHAARKPGDTEITPAQCAWLFRARHLARAVTASKFTNTALSRALVKLRSLLLAPQELHSVPKVLAEGGIRFVILEAVPGTKIDGATFWLRGEDSPVIALSFRYDRIDWFWHTLMHEIKHVQGRDGLRQHSPVDVRLVGRDMIPHADKPAFERAADAFACDYLIPQAELDDFIGRVSPLYSRLKINQFAARMNVHAGLVVGQLQHRNEVPYSHLRDALVTAKSYIADSALTDGWGSTLELA